MRTPPILIFCLLTTGSVFGENNHAPAAAPPVPWNLPHSPQQDLSSPDPVVRAHAAAEIKTAKLYRTTDDIPWRRVMARVKKGESIEVTFERFRKAGAINVPSSIKDVPRTCDFAFQLDDSWKFEMYYRNDILASWHLLESPRIVEVTPLANYSGTWMVYAVDGTAHRENYTNGKPAPVF